MIANNLDPFPAADLEANRSGRLTDTQRARLRGLTRAGRKDELLLSVLSVALAVFLVAAGGTAPNAWLRPLAAAGLLVVAVLLLRAAVTGDSLTKDLRSGRVETVEGAIGKRTQDLEGEHSRHTLFYLDVAGQEFLIDRAAYDAAPDVGIVRLYVLPRSHVILNLERLPDRPLPEGATTSPQVAIGAAITSMLSSDPVKSAEAKAELAAIGNAMKAQMAGVAAPTAPTAGSASLGVAALVSPVSPDSEPDPRPLAESIVGTWQIGPMSMSFLPEGTLVATLPGGRQQRGRWSIGPDGRLHANPAGRDQTLDARVAGDMLMISENGRPMAYRRAAGN